MLNGWPWVKTLSWRPWLLVRPPVLAVGRDRFNQNFRKFRSKTQWIGSVQPEKFRKNRSTFWGGPLFPVGPVSILVEWIAPVIKTLSQFRWLRHLGLPIQFRWAGSGPGVSVCWFDFVPYRCDQTSTNAADQHLLFLSSLAAGCNSTCLILYFYQKVHTTVIRLLVIKETF